MVRVVPQFENHWSECPSNSRLSLTCEDLETPLMSPGARFPAGLSEVRSTPGPGPRFPGNSGWDKAERRHWIRWNNAFDARRWGTGLLLEIINGIWNRTSGRRETCKEAINIVINSFWSVLSCTVSSLASYLQQENRSQDVVPVLKEGRGRWVCREQGLLQPAHLLPSVRQLEK